jgi:hypothetical protein
MSDENPTNDGWTPATHGWWLLRKIKNGNMKTDRTALVPVDPAHRDPRPATIKFSGLWVCDGHTFDPATAAAHVS